MENATYTTLRNHFAAQFDIEDGRNFINLDPKFTFTDDEHCAYVRITEDFTSVEIYVEANRTNYIRTERKLFNGANYRDDAALIAAVEAFIAK